MIKKKFTFLAALWKANFVKKVKGNWAYAADPNQQFSKCPYCLRFWEVRFFWLARNFGFCVWGVENAVEMPTKRLKQEKDKRVLFN